MPWPGRLMYCAVSRISGRKVLSSAACVAAAAYHRPRTQLCVPKIGEGVQFCVHTHFLVLEPLPVATGIPTCCLRCYVRRFCLGCPRL